MNSCRRFTFAKPSLLVSFTKVLLKVLVKHITYVNIGRLVRITCKVLSNVVFPKCLCETQCSNELLYDEKRTYFSLVSVTLTKSGNCSGDGSGVGSLFLRSSYRRKEAERINKGELGSVNGRVGLREQGVK